MRRAYALIETKAVDEDQRVIEGIASTATVDRHGDIVEPLGASFRLPLPLLWQHRADEPIGHVEWAQPSATGIPFRARFVKVDEAGPLKDRLDTAWQSVKSGLVRACSIGFVPVEAEPIATGYRYRKWSWAELSCVTIPANVEATIENAKHFDQQVRESGGAIGRVRAKLKGSVADAYADSFDQWAETVKAPDWKPSAPGMTNIDMLAHAAVAAAHQTDVMLKAMHDRIVTLEARHAE